MEFEFLHSRAPRILLVRYAAEITGENITRLNGMLARYVGEHGPTNTIIDFSTTPAKDISGALLAERGREPTRMVGFHRAFIIRENQRLAFENYTRTQKAHGDDPPILVRSIEEGLARMNSAGASFQSIRFTPGPPRRP
jgi:hypothetical protein